MPASNPSLVVAARLVAPIGILALSGNDTGLLELRLPEKFDPEPYGEQGCVLHAETPVDEHHPVAEAARQLQAYFADPHHVFTIPLADSRATHRTLFQQQVDQALCDIPVGEFLTYGGLAHRIGKPAASRAVGGALNRNPFPIIVPCHRVLAKGNLGGYAVDVEIKKYLLKHEGCVVFDV